MSEVFASAPSNIALIKYMGKTENVGNRPTNASLSYTLEHLRSFVRIKELPQIRQISGAGNGEDQWKAWKSAELYPLELNEKGKVKFLSHFSLLKKEWNISGSYLIESANNFPSDAGLASSASSFAALTLAAAELKKRKDPLWKMPNMEALSELSRRGSGSSCRSFFSPWAIWKSEGAQSIELGGPRLHHMVVLLEEGKKEVSSSDAHRRVVTSPLFQFDQSGLSRPVRAEKRLHDLIEAWNLKNWSLTWQIVWDEFWDMHELFHTSTPQFGYLTDQCRELLIDFRERWNAQKDGPLVTLDAGPNVHLLFADLEQAKSEMSRLEQKGFKTLTSWHTRSVFSAKGWQ